MKRLEDIPKKNPFNTPDGYFDEFPSSLKNRLNTGKEKEPVTLLTTLKPYFYFIAFFVAFAFIFKFGVDKLTKDYRHQENELQSSVETELYYEYEFISENMIYEEMIALQDSTIINEINEEMITAYLVEEDIEYLMYE
ncbi:MAG: hypothetical protein U9Q98_04025 [Bacteroidota bacterium]|nr:hypothetical protein [Bacteroidota bacterium]